MPYEAMSGRYELASRIGHRDAVIRAAANKRIFHYPVDELSDATWVVPLVKARSDFPVPAGALRTDAVIAIDGSRMTSRIRDGLPSMVYGFAQTAAVYVDLNLYEDRRTDTFPDPHLMNEVSNASLLSVDFPVAGIYAQPGVDIRNSWRTWIDDVFRTKAVEVDNRNALVLIDLLFMLHGIPGHPATTVPVNCPDPNCDAKDVRVPKAGTTCTCGAVLYATDTMRIHEEVVEEGTNEGSLGRLMSVIELLVLVGIVMVLWNGGGRQSILPRTLFVVDGPLAMFGPPAKLREKALTFFQAMAPGMPNTNGPHIVGLQKTGPVVDFAETIARHDLLKPGELLVCDETFISKVSNTSNPKAFGKETYWGRMFIYRTLDGRILVPTLLPYAGPPYGPSGGQPDPSAYPTLPAILDVFDRTGSAMYRNGIVPVALAHGKAAFPIGVGTDVLKIATKHILGMSIASPP